MTVAPPRRSGGELAEHGLFEGDSGLAAPTIQTRRPLREACPRPVWCRCPLPTTRQPPKPSCRPTTRRSGRNTDDPARPPGGTAPGSNICNGIRFPSTLGGPPRASQRSLRRGAPRAPAPAPRPAPQTACDPARRPARLSDRSFGVWGECRRATPARLDPLRTPPKAAHESRPRRSWSSRRDLSDPAVNVAPGASLVEVTLTSVGDGTSCAAGAPPPARRRGWSSRPGVAFMLDRLAVPLPSPGSAGTSEQRLAARRRPKAFLLLAGRRYRGSARSRFQCRETDASHRSSPTGTMANRLTVSWPPSWSPYSRSTVSGRRRRMASRTGANEGSDGSRRRPARSPRCRRGRRCRG